MIGKQRGRERGIHAAKDCRVDSNPGWSTSAMRLIAVS